MPKPGYKSITVMQDIYDELYADYAKIRTDLYLEGITSFSGYVTQLLFLQSKLKSKLINKEKA